MMDIKDRFFKDDKLVQMPKKEKMKAQLFDELIKAFDRHRVYKEKEVNGILKEIYPDYAVLRRYLVDYQYLRRTADGSRYQVDSKVMLKFYEPSYYSDLEKYVLTDEHAYFSARPLDALESCENNDERHLVLIIQRRQVAGVFILQSGNIVHKYVSNPDALVMFNYSVDSTKQARGVATESFRALDAFVNKKYDGVKEVAIGVNVRNKAARYVYEKGGFTDTGNSFEGPLGRQFIMSRGIKK